MRWLLLGRWKFIWSEYFFMAYFLTWAYLSLCTLDTIPRICAFIRIPYHTDPRISILTMIRTPINKNTTINTGTRHSKTIIEVNTQFNFPPCFFIDIVYVDVIEYSFLYTLLKVICLILLPTTVKQDMVAWYFL